MPARSQNHNHQADASAKPPSFRLTSPVPTRFDLAWHFVNFSKEDFPVGHYLVSKFLPESVRKTANFTRFPVEIKYLAPM